jgi:hypothetical protein
MEVWYENEKEGDSSSVFRGQFPVSRFRRRYCTLASSIIHIVVDQIETRRYKNRTISLPCNQNEKRRLRAQHGVKMYMIKLSCPAGIQAWDLEQTPPG